MVLNGNRYPDSFFLLSCLMAGITSAFHNILPYWDPKGPWTRNSKTRRQRHRLCSVMEPQSGPAQVSRVPAIHQQLLLGGREKKESKLEINNCVPIQIPYLCSGLSYFNSVSLIFPTDRGRSIYLTQWHSLLHLHLDGPALSMATPFAPFPSNGNEAYPRSRLRKTHMAMIQLNSHLIHA